MLKYVYLNICESRKRIQQYVETIDTMFHNADCGVEVILWSGEDISNPEDSLLITDRDIECGDKNHQETAVLGFGNEYHGRAPYVLEAVEGTGASYFQMVYSRFHNIPITVFDTKRLLVREMTEDDLPELYSIYDENITKYVEPLYEYEEELKFTREYIRNMYGFFGYGLWLVFLKSTGELIGRIGLENREIDGRMEVELGYLIGTKYQRKGYAYECCRKALEYAFQELQMEGIFLCSESNNLPSTNLAKRLGFELYAKNANGLDIYSISKAYFMNDTALSL